MTSPWLDTLDAADYLRFKGSEKNRRRSVYRFIERHGLVVRHDGRRVLIARADVDQVLSLRHQLHHGSQGIESLDTVGSPS